MNIEKIKTLLEGMRPLYVAKKTGLSYQTVVNFCKGKNCTIKTVEILAEFLKQRGEIA